MAIGDIGRITVERQSKYGFCEIVAAHDRRTVGVGEIDNPHARPGPGDQPPVIRVQHTHRTRDRADLGEPSRLRRHVRDEKQPDREGCTETSPGYALSVVVRHGGILYSAPQHEEQDRRKGEVEMPNLVSSMVLYSPLPIG